VRISNRQSSGRTAKARTKSEVPGILTVAEIARLLEAASQDMLPYLAIGAFAGLRRAELERLGSQDVHFDSELIEVTAEKAKTARRQFVRMRPNLSEWLLPLRTHRVKVYPENFRKVFDAAREAARIVKWPDNALRHSFAWYDLAHFKNVNAHALEMEHTNSGMIFEHYRELVKPREVERYRNLRPVKKEKVVPLVTHA
jgi:integrase